MKIYYGKTFPYLCKYILLKISSIKLYTNDDKMSCVFKTSTLFSPSMIHVSLAILLKWTNTIFVQEIFWFQHSLAMFSVRILNDNQINASKARSPEVNIHILRKITRKSKNWLARNQDNVFEWGDMYNRGLLFQ